MQNPIPKFRQNSIISEKPKGITSIKNNVFRLR